MEFQGLALSEPQIGFECNGEIVRKITKKYKSRDDKSSFTIENEAHCVEKTHKNFRLFPDAGMHCSNKWVNPTVENVKYLRGEINGEVWTCPRNPQ